jgi:uncharacterized membrane protein YciS (DUF1049 family)
VSLVAVLLCVLAFVVGWLIYALVVLAGRVTALERRLAEPAREGEGMGTVGRRF